MTGRSYVWRGTRLLRALRRTVAHGNSGSLSMPASKDLYRPTCVPVDCAFRYATRPTWLGMGLDIVSCLHPEGVVRGIHGH
jgi:hypothetical protein